MIELTIGVVVLTAILSFCFKRAYRRGYEAGGLKVLDEWKKTMDEIGEASDDEQCYKK